MGSKNLKIFIPEIVCKSRPILKINKLIQTKFINNLLLKIYNYKNINDLQINNTNIFFNKICPKMEKPHCYAARFFIFLVGLLNKQWILNYSM